ncbi:MAG: hypothetical protein RLZZ546_1485, partial [Bacteroidota bacterium]
MKLFLPFFIIGLFFSSTSSFAQTKALVGGTLIDGYGGSPIHNSVIIIKDKKII